MVIAFWVALIIWCGFYVAAWKYSLERSEVVTSFLAFLALVFVGIPFAVRSFQMIFGLNVFSYWKAMYTGFWFYLVVKLFQAAGRFE